MVSGKRPQRGPPGVLHYQGAESSLDTLGIDVTLTDSGTNPSTGEHMVTAKGTGLPVMLVIDAGADHSLMGGDTQ